MAKVDFFAYTFKGINIQDFNYNLEYISSNLPILLPDPIYHYIKENHCESCIPEVAGMGYKFRLSFPNIGVNIFSCGATSSHGIHVVLSGTILSLCEMNRDKFLDFNNSINDRITFLWNNLDDDDIFLSDISFNCSRIDIAYDFNVNFEEFFDRVENKFYFSNSRKLPVMNINPDKHGTIYLGSRSCAVFVRIYDKALEIKEKNKKLLDAVNSDVPENFTRVEFEFKNDSKYKNAINAYKLFLESDESIGNMCYHYLKFFDSSEDGEKTAWEVYESVILYNCDDFQVEYSKVSNCSINLSYLQICANLIVTYCRRMPGLMNYLCQNLSPSKSALNKTSNVYLDFAAALENAREIVNDQEKIILEHLTFFHNDLTGVELDPNSNHYQAEYDYYFSHRLSN